MPTAYRLNKKKENLISFLSRRLDSRKDLNDITKVTKK